MRKDIFCWTWTICYSHALLTELPGNGSQNQMFVVFLGKKGRVGFLQPECLAFSLCFYDFWAIKTHRLHEKLLSLLTLNFVTVPAKKKAHISSVQRIDKKFYSMKIFYQRLLLVDSFEDLSLWLICNFFSTRIQLANVFDFFPHCAHDVIRKKLIIQWTICRIKCLFISDAIWMYFPNISFNYS